jgi:PTS system mannose-specific IIC component
MEVSLIQAILIGVFTYLGAIHTPFLGCTGGWYSIGRPLVAGTIVGAILGDIQTGMLIGATINAIFIGAITPGGAMAADLNFAGFIGTALAMMVGASPEVAVTLAVPIGLVGVFAWNAWSTITVFFAHMADKYAQQGNVKGIWISGILFPQILGFIFRFLPAFLVVYLGAPMGEAISAAIPQWLTDALGDVGRMLPAVGMALLLKMMITKFDLWAFFLFGFIAVAVFKLPIVPLTIIGFGLALVILYLRSSKEAENV